MEESPVVKEWQDKAVVAALRKKALLVLQDKFPGAVPSDLEAALNAQKDIDTMNEWFDRLFRAKTLDEVRAAFGLSSGSPKKTPKRRR